MLNKVILFLGGIFLLNGCWVDNNSDKDDIFQIKLVNKSNEHLALYFSNAYPDTSVKYVADCGCKEIKSGITGACMERYGWKDHVYSLCKGGKLSLFLFNRDSINQYTWDTVEAKYMIVKRWDLSIADLETMNWTITYP